LELKDSPVSVGRLEISYPCRWGYTLIGSDAEALRRAARRAAGDRRIEFEEGLSSRQKRYQSLRFSLEVSGEAEREAILESLRACPDVTLIL